MLPRVPSLFLKRVLVALFATGISVVLVALFLEWYARSQGMGQQKEWRFRQDIYGSAGRTYDFIVLGGSTSFGLGLADEETWIRILQSRLAKDSGSPVDVLNLARLGSHLPEEIYDYQRIIRRPIARSEWAFGDRPRSRDVSQLGFSKFQYKYALIVPVVNDTAPLLYTVPSFYRFTPLYAIRKLLMTFNGTSIFDPSAALELMRFFETRLYRFDRSLLASTKELYKTHLIQLIDLLGRRKVVLVGLPIKYNRPNYKNLELCDSDQPSRCEHVLAEAEYLTESIAIESSARHELSSTYGIKLCELSGLFGGLDAPAIAAMFNDSIHLSAKASATVAGALQSCLHNYAVQ